MLTFLVTICTVAAHTPSASTLVKEREQAGAMDLKEALEMIQYRNEIPAEVKAALKPKAHKKASHGTQLMQGKQGPDADTLRKLDEARVILNKMYIANQEELDIVIWDCRVYIHGQIALMDENTRLRTMMGAAAARAKAAQLDANAKIKEAKGELKALNGALEDHEAGCAETLGAARDQEKILANDYEVGMMIQNATEDTCMKKAGVTLVQCHSKNIKGEADEEYSFGNEFKDVDTKFSTPLGKEAMQRMLKLSLQMQDTHFVKKQFSMLQFDRNEMRARRMHVPSPSPAESKLTPAPAPAPVSDAHAEAMAMSDRPKCSTDNADCPLLLDQVSSMVGEILDGLQKIRQEIAETEEHCRQVTSDYEGQIGEWEGILDEEQVKLAEAIEVENTNTEALRQKVIEYEALNEEYLSKKEECDAKKTEITNTLCGIKVVRVEVYHNEEVYDVMIQDCEVGDWVDDDCSVTCGGGTQLVTREILQEMDLGAECPPVSISQECNQQGCPVNCLMKDWSEWGSCSKDCGGGVHQKTRGITIDAVNGGEACEATDNAEMCNTGACDVDCVLAEWGEWEQCSKACNGGIEIRRKEILEDIKGMGKCISENSKERFEERVCNMEVCPPNLVCNSRADIVLVLDGSGSVRPGGFAATKLFAHNLVERFEMGEHATKVGLIRFSKRIKVLQQMTFDKESLLSEIDEMDFPASNTKTSGALSKALDVLTAGGRKDVPKSNTIVFLVTDGIPNNAMATKKTAEKVRAAARLVVVPVGSGMGKPGLEDMMSWATFPPEENVLQAQDYDALPSKISNFIADVCKDLKCSEDTEVADQTDYIGCQDTTIGGLGCQKWTQQDPNPHDYKPDEEGVWPAEYASANILGGHNFCRNPDKKAGGIWCYTTSINTPWDYCKPRASNATGW